MKKVLALLALLIATTAAFAQSPAPALIVLNKGSNELAIVDPASQKVVARIPVGEGPHEVATDGKLAVVGNYGARTPGQSLSVVDLASMKEIKRVDLGALRRPHGMVFAGGKVWFTAEVNRLVARYDPQSGTIDFLFGTGQPTTHMLVLTHDENKIFTSNIGGDSVSCLENTPRGWTATVIPVGKAPEAIDMSPDEKEVWSSAGGDGTVAIIDVASKTVKQTLPALTKHSNRLKFTPDGKRVLISDPDAGEVVVVDVARREAIKRINVGGQPLGILIQPDGKRAYIALAQEGAVALLDLNSLEITGKIPTGPQVDGMAWVEQGKR